MAKAPDRDVDVESPSPGVSVGQPSTKGRPENRCDDHTQGEHGHRKAAFLRRKVSSKIDCESGCSAPPPAPCTARAIRIIARLVDDPQANDENREDYDARNKKPLAPEAQRKPGTGRQDNGIGDQITCQHPCGLVVGCRQTAGDVRQGDGGDGSIEYFHESRPA